jgi:cytochrome c-type biogenesis protein CcmF
MVVHPPILFAGYAALIAPFALAIAALARGAYQEWNRAVWPWALLAVALLGTGIALGGVWAYKVLGWGGYWGWDPVENASLVPWLIAVALLHGLLIQRTRGALTRTNLTLAMLAWLAVLAGTWLTRSGALEKFSVHSFPVSGIGPPLLAFLLASLALGAVLLAARWSALAAGESSWATLSRESALWAGLMTVMVFATLVAFGTAAPVLTSLAGAPASLSSSFYVRISIPLGIATVLLMGIAPALRWSKQAGWSWLGALLPGLVVGAVTLAALLLTGRVREPGQVALLALSGGALGINAWTTARLFRRGWSYGAGYLGHAGIAIMVLGMILSTTLGKTERLRLESGVSREAMGYGLTYLGETVDARGKHQLRVRVREGRREIEVAPELFKMPRGEGVMRKPYISRRPDLYLSPVEVESGSADPSDSLVWLARGESVTVGGATYTFGSFRLESNPGFRVYANVEVSQGGTVAKAAPGMIMEGGSRRPIEASVPGVGTLSVAGIDADHGRVALRVPGSRADAAVLELSTKPLVDLVWIGALLALLGAVVAGIRRAMEVTSGRQAAARPAAAAAK